MSVVLNKKNVLSALAICSKAVSNNNVIPITKCYLLEVSETKMTVSASNSFITLSHTIPCEAKTSFSIAVQADILNDLVSKMDDESFTMAVKEEKQMVNHGEKQVETTYYTAMVKTSVGIYAIPAENGADFVKIKNEVVQTLVLDGEIVSTGLSRTLFALDSDPTLPLGNLSIDFELDKVIFSSGNRHVFSTYEYDAQCSASAKLMVHPSAANALGGMPIKGETSVIISKNSIGFYWGESSAIAVLSGEKFVPLKQAIPCDNDIFVEVDRVALKNANARMKSFANRETYELEVEFNEKGITITANDYDYKKKAKELIRASVMGRNLKIGLSGTYLNQCLSKLEGDTVYIHMKEYNTAVILRDYAAEEQKPENLLLIMPILLAQ